MTQQPQGSTAARTTIRPLVASDAEAFRSLRLRALREEPTAFDAAEETETEIPLADIPGEFGFAGDGSESFVLGAVSAEGRLVGCIGCERDSTPKRRHRALIWGMYVAPESRRTGLGRALLDHAMALATRWEGLESVRLGVIVPNDAARTLYASAGFETVWIEKEAYKTDEGYLGVELMRKRV